MRAQGNRAVVQKGWLELVCSGCTRHLRGHAVCVSVMRWILSQGPTRGGNGWETSLRQKPPSRAVFQAGRGTWAKPVGLDKDSPRGRESEDELVGVLTYPTGPNPLDHPLMVSHGSTVVHVIALSVPVGYTGLTLG